MAPGNNATLPATPYSHCTSDVYVIDTVLLPSDQLADIPPFSSICAWYSDILCAIPIVLAYVKVRKLDG